MYFIHYLVLIQIYYIPSKKFTNININNYLLNYLLHTNKKKLHLKYIMYNIKIFYTMKCIYTT